LTVKDVGAVLVPECVPWKPISVLAPGASVAFQDIPVAVTTAPVCVQVADQPCEIFWPDGNVKPSDHVSGDVPVFVILTEPVKPVFQLLAE